MKFKGDYHIHTVFSDGKNTPEEMAAAAVCRGLREVGFSEHGPSNFGTGVKNNGIYLEVQKLLQDMQPRYPGLKLLTGAEADIVDINGRLDVSKEIIKKLDYLIVGLHPYIKPAGIKAAGWILGNQAARLLPPLRSCVRNNNTKAVVEALYNYDAWAVSHPGLKMDIEIKEVARACIATDTAWEINTGHRFPSYRDVVEAAKCGVDFVVNSDAHFPETVGAFDYGSWVLEKANVAVERVKNAIDE